MEEIYDLPGYSGTAEEEIRCSVIISNNAIATEAGACVEHRASGYAEALGFFGKVGAGAAGRFSHAARAPGAHSLLDFIYLPGLRVPRRARRDSPVVRR